MPSRTVGVRLTSSATGPTPDPTAVVGKRVAAAVIDATLALLVYIPILALGTYTFYERIPASSVAAAEEICDESRRVGSDPDIVCIPIGEEAIEIDMADFSDAMFRIYLWALLISVLNPILLQGLTGATIGKFALGLRVVRADGSIAGIGREALRYLLYLVEGGFIALILIAVTRGHRRLGDMAAKTYVVPRRYLGAPIELPPDPTAVQYGPPSGSPDGPHWDPQRNTYLLFDRTSNGWLQWNERFGRWDPINQ